jgi:large subunit ribosomal protein L2
MGKRITQQARGRGGPTFKVRKRAFMHKIGYPRLDVEGKAVISRLIGSAGHSAPLAEIKINGVRFVVPAADGVYEGQEIFIGKRPENMNAEVGDVVRLRDLDQGTKVFNVERSPGDGGKFLRTAGSSGVVMDRDVKGIGLGIKRRVVKLNEEGRAVVGVISGDGRRMKPLVKAGKRHHIMKSQGRKWHRTSAVKVNAIDHPFGGGRGKRIKSKIAKRNSPPGLKVGHIRPSKTGRKKGKRK